MRKRWTFDPFPFGAVWIFGGLVLWIVAMSLWNGCDREGCGMDASHLGTVGLIGLCIWLGPIVLVLGGCLVGFTAVALWNARPRRVVEPVLTDLRKADRIG